MAKIFEKFFLLTFQTHYFPQAEVKFPVRIIFKRFSVAEITYRAF
jgi:hypothetical protein